ncbi:branched-chain amino acid ABC transporter permease [Paucibacter sp. R3-3]|uniref:Branched-chain amino acid ABC transporter permease n=1 Tax=Roseateles agri TaxID=3098619 RepID=A0ABU5DP04_9BURK|nr:branched-chain amino acid ABC transporter permease [Paucibacter sp. R3-3]MDY0748046.1 branched-chain amino acid ABC transporter permease [Paucibacter sp. R3-3]
MNSDLIYSTTMAGVVTGSYYALLGISLALIYRTTSVANFAQGHLGTLGVFLLFMYVSKLNFGAWGGVLVAVLLASIISGAIYIALLRPKPDTDHMGMTIKTLGLFMLVHAVLLYAWGENEPYVMTGIFSNGSVSVGGFFISYEQMGTLAIAAVLAITFLLLMRYTRTGLAMRSVALNSEVATLLGVNVDKVGALVWMISGGIGALVAMLIAPVSFLGTNLMEPYILKAFTAAILGGLTSFPGVIAGGLILGVLESYAATWISISLREPFTFAVLLLVLVFRPNGLFGKVHLERV